MAKREFLQLAHKYDAEAHSPAGMMASEKLDGQRCFWDGGISTGHSKAEVPWANTLKDERYRSTQVATGLWSRYGNVIHAPSWFIESLPKIPMDGEFYIPGYRQDLMSIIKTIKPDEEMWKKVQYFVFDAVPLCTLLAPGMIDTTNFKKRIPSIAMDWAQMHSNKIVWYPDVAMGFKTRLAGIRNRTTPSEHWHVHEQVELPTSTVEARRVMDEFLERVVAAGGEGLIIRAPNAIYECNRTWSMLKVKPCDDAEGVVVGYTSGRLTTLGSKLIGKMGALIIQLYNGKEMELSGFTDEEREFVDNDWAFHNPGQRCPSYIINATFPMGTKVTFKYRGTSKDGIPQEARYWRKRNDE